MMTGVRTLSRVRTGHHPGPETPSVADVGRSSRPSCRQSLPGRRSDSWLRLRVENPKNEKKSKVLNKEGKKVK